LALLALPLALLSLLPRGCLRPPFLHPRPQRLKVLHQLASLSHRSLLLS
jgi:hypothetical protein